MCHLFSQSAWVFLEYGRNELYFASILPIYNNVMYIIFFLFWKPQKPKQTGKKPQMRPSKKKPQKRPSKKKPQKRSSKKKTWKRLHKMWNERIEDVMMRKILFAQLKFSKIYQNIFHQIRYSRALQFVCEEKLIQHFLFPVRPSNNSRTVVLNSPPTPCITQVDVCMFCISPKPLLDEVWYHKCVQNNDSSHHKTH